MTDFADDNTAAINTPATAESIAASQAAWVEFEATREIIATALALRKNIGLLTEEEVAKVLQLKSTGTLATWRSQRAGPRYVKLGKTVFYVQNALITWINQLVVEQDTAYAAAAPENQVAKAA